MVQYVITPWRNSQELLHVRAQLYPTEQIRTKARRGEVDEAKAHAVAKVSVWVQRGNCPHLVESTAILTSAILNDVPGNSVYCVRAAYSAAFCRFVTGILDSHQDKRRKMSMYAIAKTIGLPATYVELRHQATHEELPSLSKLRAGTQKALRWIWEYYWTHLAEVTEAAPTVDECKVLVKSILSEKTELVRRKLEVSLGRYDDDHVFDVIMEIQSTTSDPATLMRLIHLQEELLSPASSSQERGNNEAEKTLDEVRAELAAIEQDLSSEEAEEPARKRRKGGEQKGKSEASKAWAIWEGPWVPKPIGVV